MVKARKALAESEKYQAVLNCVDDAKAAKAHYERVEKEAIEAWPADRPVILLEGTKDPGSFTHQAQVDKTVTIKMQRRFLAQFSDEKPLGEVVQAYIDANKQDHIKIRPVPKIHKPRAKKAKVEKVALPDADSVSASSSSEDDDVDDEEEESDVDVVPQEAAPEAMPVVA